MDTSPDVVLKLVAGTLAFLGFVTLWRQRREQVLTAQIALIREAWLPLAQFSLKLRQWSDGVMA